MKWLFLSKNNQDEYIARLAKGYQTEPTPLETWRYEDTVNPIVLRGIMKHKIIRRCWEDGRKFRYMDTGYFGNQPGPLNPHGWKLYHRIVENNLQHGDIVERPSDRWEKLGIKLRPRQSGKKILIAAPDEKPCVFYGIELETWITDVVEKLKRLTRRPIEIRQRDPNRQKRVNNSFESALDDVHAVITFNSIAATESIIHGVPAFVLCECNAARSVANTDLSRIEDPVFPDNDLRQAWVNHLAYGQFHNRELEDGTARRILEGL